ncbi:MAG: hypothetical protein ACLPVY_17570 [Acidimicrobiia bacterium]
MIAVGEEQVVNTEMPSSEKVPLVAENAEEPDLGSVYDEDDRSDNFGDGERDKRRPGVRVVASGTMQDVGKVIREMTGIDHTDEVCGMICSLVGALETGEH